MRSKKIREKEFEEKTKKGVVPFWENYLTYMQDCGSCNYTLESYMSWINKCYSDYAGTLYAGYNGCHSFTEFVEEEYPSKARLK